MLFAFEETVKQVVDANYWTITLPTIIGGVIVGIGGVILTAITVFAKVVAAIRDLKSVLQKDIKDNTDAQNAILPAVTAKADSATKEAVEAKDEAKKAANIAASKAVEVLGQKLENRADLAADKVAVVTKQSHDEIAGAVGQIANAIRGTDGTCLTAKVKKHGEILQGLRNDHSELNGRVAKLEQVATEGLGILREMKKATGS